jgi:hypothetical protein
MQLYQGLSKTVTHGVFAFRFTKSAKSHAGRKLNNNIRFREFLHFMLDDKKKNYRGPRESDLRMREQM